MSNQETPRVTYRKTGPTRNVEVCVNGQIVLTATKSSWGGYNAQVGDLFKTWSTLSKLKANVRTRVGNYLRWGFDLARLYQPLTDAEKEVLAAERRTKTEAL
jgi:hypothetical protein